MKKRERVCKRKGSERGDAGREREERGRNRRERRWRRLREGKTEREMGGREDRKEEERD